MDMTLKMTGLEEAMNTIRNAFPNNLEVQRKVLGQTMSRAAGRTIIPEAKRLALSTDGSGVLSETIKPRMVSKSKALAAGVASRVHITPVRDSRPGIQKYIDHYYTSRGKAAPTTIVTSGIRHGHLIEFGFKHRSGKVFGGRPFLGPALQHEGRQFVRVFANKIEHVIKLNVRRLRRRARKAAK